MSTSEDMKTLRAAKAAAATLMSSEQTIRSRYDALSAEDLAVEQSTRALSEVLANKDRLVDEAADRWATEHAQTLVRLIAGYTEAHGPIGTPDRIVAPALPRNSYSQHGPDTLGFEDLCGLAPELMKARLDVVIRRSGANFGLPAEERATRLAELDAAIAATVAQHCELVDGAAEVGITLPLLDCVRDQRAADAKREARERELVAERARVAAGER